MMTEDELHSRLHEETAGISPSGDLLESLARGHARRHRRVRMGVVGGSLVATALVGVLLTGLFTSPPTLQVQTASPGNAEIIKRVQAADTAAGNMIMNFRTAEGSGAVHESWVLRSENLGRIARPNVYDTTIKPPDTQEHIDYAERTVTTTHQPVDDVVAFVSGSGVGDPRSWLHDKSLTVAGNGNEIHLTANRYGVQMDMWVDAKSHLLLRATFGSYQMDFTWLPATEENRKLLEHTVPADFTPKTAGEGKRKVPTTVPSPTR